MPLVALISNGRARRGSNGVRTDHPFAMAPAAREPAFGTAWVHPVVVRGRHFSTDGEGFASNLPKPPRRPSWRFLDGMRKNFRVALSATIFTFGGFVGLLVSFDPGRAGERMTMLLALLFGLAQWGLVYLLGDERPWPGDEPQ